MVDNSELSDLIEELGRVRYQTFLNQYINTLVAELEDTQYFLNKNEITQAAKVLHGATGSSAVIGAKEISAALRILEIQISGKQNKKNTIDIVFFEGLIAEFVINVEAILKKLS